MVPVPIPRNDRDTLVPWYCPPMRQGDAQKYFSSTKKSTIIQKYLIMEPPEK